MEDRVRNCMSRILKVPAAEIGVDASPETIEAWDSLRQMNLVLALEEEFDVKFSDENIVEMLSFPLICEVLREQVAA